MCPIFQEIKDDLQLTDASGKKLDAILVFARSLEYFKNHLLSFVKDQLPEVKPREIGWVITVPAIWNDSAKKLMRKAAEMVNVSYFMKTIC